MDLLGMRNLLRRHLDDLALEDLEDTELNQLLRAALTQVQKLVLFSAPNAFFKVGAPFNIVAGTEFYALPSDFWSLYELGRLDVSSNKYKALGKQSYAFLRDYDSTDVVYAIMGNQVALAPIPSANLTNGLRFLYVPILTMAADVDVPAVHEGLHMAIVLWAKVFALPETAEPAEETKKVLTEILVDIPSYYPTGTDGNEHFTLPNKDY